MCRYIYAVAVVSLIYPPTGRSRSVKDRSSTKFAAHLSMHCLLSTDVFQGPWLGYMEPTRQRHILLTSKVNCAKENIKGECAHILQRTLETRRSQARRASPRAVHRKMCCELSTVAMFHGVKTCPCRMWVHYPFFICPVHQFL